MWRVLVHDIECRRLRSCIDESCAVCYAMTMRNEKKSNTHISGRLCALSLRSCLVHSSLLTSLPLTVLPIPDVPAPTRPVLLSIKTALVHVTMTDTPCYIRKRSLV